MENTLIEYKESTTEAKMVWENHCHAKYELICVLNGNITITIEGRNFHCIKNHFIIIPPLKFHSVSAKDNSVYKRIIVLFEQKDIPKEISQDFSAKIKSNSLIYHIYNQQISEQLLHCVKNDFFKPLLKSLLVQIMYLSLQDDSAKMAGEPSEKVSAILRFVDKNIAEKITLDDISRATYLSKSTICHLFVNEMNTTIKQYILQKKMAYANYLIKSGCSATSAAEKIGYDNYSNFYRIFKKINGVAPTDNKKKW